MTATTQERADFRADWHWLTERFGSKVEINLLSLTNARIDYSYSPPRITAESDSHIFVFQALNTITFPQASEGESIPLFVHRIKAPVFIFYFIQNFTLLGGTFVKQDSKNESKTLSNSFELWLVSKKSKLPIKERVQNFFRRKQKE